MKFVNPVSIRVEQKISSLESATFSKMILNYSDMKGGL